MNATRDSVDIRLFCHIDCTDGFQWRAQPERVFTPRGSWEKNECWDCKLNKRKTFSPFFSLVEGFYFLKQESYRKSPAGSSIRVKTMSAMFLPSSSQMFLSSITWLKWALDVIVNGDSVLWWTGDPPRPWSVLSGGLTLVYWQPYLLQFVYFTVNSVAIFIMWDIYIWKVVIFKCS